MSAAASEGGTTKPAKKAAKKSYIRRDTLMRAIALCHPDRHGNSREANDVTAALLALRK